MPSDLPKYRLSIQSKGTHEEFAYFTVYNGFMAVVEKFYYKKDIDLDKGMYCIEMTYNETVVKQMVVLEGDETVVIDMPESAANRPMSVSEKASYSLFQSFRNKTTTQFPQEAAAPAPGFLYLFFHVINNPAITEAVKTSLGKGFLLLDSAHQVMCSIAGKHIKQDVKAGWLALNVALPAGNYYLHYKGKKEKRGEASTGKGLKAGYAVPAREMPVRVFSGLQTELILFFDTAPLFSSALINIISPHAGEAGDESLHKLENDKLQIEGILQKFRNGITYVPDSVIEEFTRDKWIHPFKGLLAAYVYFSSSKLGKIIIARNKAEEEAIEKEKEKGALFAAVVSNLTDILGQDSPDVQALQLIISNQFSQPLPRIRLDEPPMFLAGTKALIQATLLHPKIVKPGSLLEQISPGLYQDTVWTTYEPLTIVQDSIQDPPTHSGAAGGVMSLMADNPESGFDAGFSAESKALMPGGAAPQKQKTISSGLNELFRSKVANTLLYIAQVNADITARNSSKKYSTDNFSADIITLNVHDAARQMQVPPSLVEETINQIINHEEQIKSLSQNKKTAARVPAGFTQSNIDQLRKIL